jgi:hypothetical protein
VYAALKFCMWGVGFVWLAFWYILMVMGVRDRERSGVGFEIKEKNQRLFYMVMVCVVRC